jgi:hypothetical protein
MNRPPVEFDSLSTPLLTLPSVSLSPGSNVVPHEIIQNWKKSTKWKPLTVFAVTGTVSLLFNAVTICPTYLATLKLSSCSPLLGELSLLSYSRYQDCH